MANPDNRPLFIFEMANNHMGDVQHGLRIIRDVAEAVGTYSSRFRLGFKLQYRQLDTFIHPGYRQRTDIKYIKRFSETELSADQFAMLKNEMTRLGFATVCTPFDEASVDLVERHGYDIVKIASCSFTDWPLLERISLCDRPIIASAAGVALRDVDSVVSFFDHRGKDFTLMHCVAGYPTEPDALELNQIELFRKRYPQARIGFSTHERPAHLQSVAVAVAKGATVFEKHVGVSTHAYQLNDYSATPEQLRDWLAAAAAALDMCGVSEGRSPFTDAEVRSLGSLRRGVYARHPVPAGARVTGADVFFAMPVQNAQFTANDWSKYAEFQACEEIDANEPISKTNCHMVHHGDRIYDIVQRVKAILKSSHAAVPRRLDLEISHHYGIETFDSTGATIINFVNRDYCKKVIVLLPGQEHPEQHHKIKEETFQILSGSIDLTLDGKPRHCDAGEIIVIPSGVRHAFRTNDGAVIEEISSKHIREDSYYTDPAISRNPARKTLVTYWME